MVAQFNGKDNIAHNIADSTALIQYNDLIHARNCTKADLKIKAGKFNSAKNWITTPASVEQLAEYLRKGYSVRGGIKGETNKTTGDETTSWLFIDFDNSTEESTKQCPIYQYACVFYYTPSYQPGVNEKHRLVFKLDRAISVKECECLVNYIIDKFYSSADRLIDAGRLFFGATKPEYVTVLNADVILPVDNFLSVTNVQLEIPVNDDRLSDLTENTPKAQTPALSNEKSKDGVKSRVLKYLSDAIWKGQCNSSDIDKLYCLDVHNFVKQPSGKNLAKWHGHRPEDKQKPDGTGFLVFWIDEDFLPMWENQATNEKGNFIEYWHKYSGKQYKSITWNDDRQYKEYGSVVSDICNYFGVPEIDVKAINDELKSYKIQEKQEKRLELIKIVHACLDEYCYKVSDSLLYWVAEKGVWHIPKKNGDVWAYLIKPMLVKLDVSTLTLEDKEFVADIKNVIFNHTFKPERLILDNKMSLFDTQTNKAVIPLKNGNWDTVSKTFDTYFDPRVFNRKRSDHHFIETDNVEELPGYKLFDYWLNKQYCPEVAKMMKAWLVVNCLGIAASTSHMVNIYGAPQTGKSVFIKIILGALGSLAIYETSDEFLAGNQFAMSSGDGAFAVVIDEFNTQTEKHWNSIKKITGGINFPIRVEKKGQSQYNTVGNFGLTTLTQDKVVRYSAGDDGGIRRRSILVKHTTDMYREEFRDIESRFFEAGVFCDIYNWAIRQDGKEAVKTVKDYYTSEHYKVVQNNAIGSVDSMLLYMQENLEFTNNPDDEVTLDSLRFDFTVWAKSNSNYDDKTIDAKARYILDNIINRAKIADNGFKWSLIPQNDKLPRVRRNGKQTYVLPGIKLINHTDTPDL